MGRPVQSNHAANVAAMNEYATVDDFEDLFAAEMVDLFRLAFLLTADAEKAEHCVVLTIHECMASASVFKWWLPVWTRTALIRNGIRIVTESPMRPPRKTQREGTLSAIRRSLQSAIHRPDESAEILRLSDFDRLVYVLSMVEHYNTRDCATFLGSSRQDVRDARNRAADQLTAYEQGRLRLPHQPVLDDLCPPPYQTVAGFDASCGSLLA